MRPFPKKVRREDLKLIEQLREKPCFFCGCPAPSEVHHIKSKKSGGHDVEWNLIPVDRKCHTEVHKRGLMYMMQKYLSAGVQLNKMGWSIDNYGRMRNHIYGGFEC